MRSRPGRTWPLGATLTSTGVDVATWSSAATAVDLALFDDAGREHRVPMHRAPGGTWHVHVDGVQAGQRYGFRVDGPYDPPAGHRCNPAKLLVDPWARGIVGEVVMDDAVVVGDDRDPDPRDSAPFVPRSVVVDPTFDWGDDAPLAIDPADTVLYEVHCKGLSMRHPDVPPDMRGTYAGAAHPAVLQHLVDLGVTAVEFLPLAARADETSLQRRGMTNYWGYMPVVNGAPDPRFAQQPLDAPDELRRMVRAYHEAGLAVVLDVVFNHTAEEGPEGPTLSLRGLDNERWYRIDAGDRRRYWDASGCGNTVDFVTPASVQLVLDVLRRWVVEYHVDGFRFDLGHALARGRDLSFDAAAPFLTAVGQDPVLQGRLLTTEPWDVNGYALGGWPAPWGEWNDAFRDTVRDFWRGVPATRPHLATRMAGSEDVFGDRAPTASVNMVTAHDGFTLRDLVSYDRKHNDANREDNRDGHDHNRSWNCGVEGPTDDPRVLALRARQQRNLLATLLLSQGMPLLLGGDELGRTQHGNNNAYCHDDELTWLDWEGADLELLDFVRRLVGLRHELPTLRRHAPLRGERSTGAHDVDWFDADAQRKVDDDWQRPGDTFQFRLDGRHSGRHDADGVALECPDLLVVVNGESRRHDVRVVEPRTGPWHVRVHTAAAQSPPPATIRGGRRLRMSSRSLAVLTDESSLQ